MLDNLFENVDLLHTINQQLKNLDISLENLQTQLSDLGKNIPTELSLKDAYDYAVKKGSLIEKIKEHERAIKKNINEAKSIEKEFFKYFPKDVWIIVDNNSYSPYSGEFIIDSNVFHHECLYITFKNN